MRRLIDNTMVMPPADDEGVGTIRANALSDLRQDIARIEERLDTADQLIGDLRELAARLDGEMRILVFSYERAAALASSQALADLEVRKTGELAAIQETADRRKHWRELSLKLAAVFAGAWTILNALLNRGC